MPEMLTTLQVLWVALICLLAGGFLCLALVRLLARREGGAAVREVVRAIEDMSEGENPRLPRVEEWEPLAPVVSSLSVLSEAWTRKISEHEKQLDALRRHLDSARGVAFAATDPEGDVTFWSEGARELTGFTQEEVRGRSIGRLLPEDVWSALLPKLSRRELREGGLVEERSRMRLRSGGDAAVDMSIVPVHDDDRRTLFFTIRDASGNERMERDLRDAGEKHRRLAEGLGEGAFVLSEGRIVCANRALEDLLSVETGQLIGKPLRDFVASEDVLRVNALIREAEGGDSSLPIDCRLLRSGSEGLIESRLTLTAATLAERPAVVGSVQDIGPTRRAWRRLKASETRLEATLEVTSDGIVMLSGPRGAERASVVNRRLAELLEKDISDLQTITGRDLGRELASRLKDGARFESFLEESCSEPSLGRREMFRLAEPSDRVIEVTSGPATGRDGDTLGCVLAFRDITAQDILIRSKESLEQANADLEKVNAKLRQRTAELDRLNEELRSLDKMKSDLLANVSHELQTPLVAIKGYTELLLQGKLGSVNDEQKKGLEIARRNIDKLIAMIDNLLSLAGTEKNLPAMRVTVFPLWDLLEECVELVRDQADRREISLTTRYLTEEMEVRGDRDKLFQVFINLLSNAIKFNRDHGEVSIAVRKGKAGYLLAEVRDTGYGIPEEMLDRVFDRFVRGGAAASGQKGTGIGLAIVRDILRLHGCTIKADSRPGEGAVFTLTLPHAGAAEERPFHRGSGTSAGGSAPTPGDTRRNEPSGGGGGRRLDPDRVRSTGNEPGDDGLSDLSSH